MWAVLQPLDCAPVELDTAPGAGIDDLTITREIEGDLNKAANVLEADVATHADGRPAIASRTLFVNAAKGISSLQLSRYLGLPAKTAFVFR